MTVTTQETRPMEPRPEPPARRGGGLRALAVAVGAIGLLVVLLVTMAVVGLLMSRVETRTRTYPAAARLEVEVRSGDVRVDAVERDDIAVEERVRFSWRRPSSSQALAGGVLRLDGGCTGVNWAPCGISYRLEVPAGTEVVVRTGGGDLRVAGVRAGVKLDTGSGEVAIDRVTGTVDVNRGAATSPSTRSRATSGPSAGSGNIDVRGVTGAVAAETSGGDVRVDGATRGARISSGSGGLTVRGVTGAVDAQTRGGDVGVARVRGDVRAHSGSGNVNVDGVTGAVDATASGGDVGVTDSTGGTVQARSGSGSIVVDGVEATRVEAVSAGGDVRVSAVERAPERVLATSGSGDVQVVVPDEVYQLSVRSGSGEVDTTGVREDSRSPRRITAHTEGGDVSVRTS